MRISVFGLGYVGAVSCACLTELGHSVVGVDVMEAKVDRIARGESPIIETGIDELIAKAVASKRLTATTSVSDAVRDSDVALVCVGTPSNASGGIDTRYLDRVCRQIGEAIRQHSPAFHCVMNRSTSLPEVHRALIAILAETSGRPMGTGIGYVCHPEFLREGIAIHDFHHPPKIVFGATDPKSEELCRQLYPGIAAETFFVPTDVAAMVKYADNCFHALKVTFGNEVGMLCKSLGIDSHQVMNVFIRDRKLNISEKYLLPGNPFGGSCLPKDLRGMLDAARVSAVRLAMHEGILESNRVQVDELVRRIVRGGRRPIGIIGLAFKEGTDDVRESPMVYLVEQLLGKGMPLRIFDRHLAVQSMVGANRSFALESIPHLTELLSHDLAEVVGFAKTLVVNHRLDAAAWGGAPLRDEHELLDLVNVPELRGRPGYDGLYW